MNEIQSTVTCTRRLTFCAGHRVMGHENKCAHLHGHNYVVEVTCEAMDGLDSIGRVIDFAIIKDKVGAWIDKHWDHGFILCVKDNVSIEAMSRLRAAGIQQKIALLDENPTAENLARCLLLNVCPTVFDGTGVIATHVNVQETENCDADAYL